MVSSTQQTNRIRRRKQSTQGKISKRARLRQGTPVFPVHPEGYDLTAADAKKPVQLAKNGTESIF